MSAFFSLQHRGNDEAASNLLIIDELKWLGRDRLLIAGGMSVGGMRYYKRFSGEYLVSEHTGHITVSDERWFAPRNR